MMKLDINSIPNGEYTLRLSVSDTNGNTNRKEAILDVDKYLHPGWPQLISGKAGYTSHPVFSDLDGDGDKEIVVGSDSGYVYVWNHDGTIVSGWPKELGGQCITTPAIGDVDNDGSLEIVVATKSDYSGSKKSYVYVWNVDGSNAIGWPKQINLEFPPNTGSAQDDASTPSLGDIDNDGFLEIIVGFNVYEKGPVYAWNYDGSVVSGWPILLGHGYTARTAIGDINNNGDIEIVGSTNNGYVYVWNGNGTESPGWPKYNWYAFAAPVLGDIDGDEDLEIVLHSNEDRMYAWHHDGSPVLGWPVQLKEYIGNPPWAPAVIGDINGDGSVEILAVAWGEKAIYAWHNDGTIVDGWPKLTSDQTHSESSPAIGDIDNDGKLEIIALDNEKAYMWDLSGTYDPANIEWGMFHHDV
jgi:hypothetical protein